MTDNIGFGQTAPFYAIREEGTIVFDSPFSQLLHEFLLIVLISRPAHMEDIGFDFGLVVEENFHKILPSVIFDSAQKGIILTPPPHLYSESDPGDTFVDCGRECGLMGLVSHDRVSHFQQSVE